MARTFGQLQNCRLETFTPREWLNYVRGYRSEGWGVRWPLKLLVWRLLLPLRHWVTLDQDTRKFRLVRVGEVRWDFPRDRYILIRSRGLRSVRGTYFTGQLVHAFRNGRSVSETCNALRFGACRPNGVYMYAPVERIVLP